MFLPDSSPSFRQQAVKHRPPYTRLIIHHLSRNITTNSIRSTMRKPRWSTIPTEMRLKQTISSPTSACLQATRTPRWVYKARLRWLSHPTLTARLEVEAIRSTRSIQCSMLIHLDSLQACIFQRRSALIKAKAGDKQSGMKCTSTFPAFVASGLLCPARYACLPPAHLLYIDHAYILIVSERGVHGVSICPPGGPGSTAGGVEMPRLLRSQISLASVYSSEAARADRCVTMV